MVNFIYGSVIEDIANELGVTKTFCYVIIAIIALTIGAAIIMWFWGGWRRKREIKEMNKKICPNCGEDNASDALLCKYCDEMLDFRLERS